MWIYYAIASGLFFSIQSLLARRILKAKRDAWAFSLYFSLVGCVVTLPFFLADPTVPTELNAWLLALLVGLLIIGNNLLMFKGAAYLPASLSTSILKLRLVWVFLLGILILGTPFSWWKLLGTALTVAAGVTIAHGLRKTESITGVGLILAATVFNALIVVLFKPLLDYYSVASSTLIVAFLLPAILNAILMPNMFRRMKALYKEDGRNILIACSTGGLSSLALSKAIDLGDVTSVVVIGEVFVILLLVGEHIFLKEKESVLMKIAAVVLATAGAILIQIS